MHEKKKQMKKRKRGKTSMGDIISPLKLGVHGGPESGRVIYGV